MSGCRIVAAIAASAMLAGCGTLPRHKDAETSAQATSTNGAANVVSHFNRARATADADLDSAALGDIEDGSVLAVDTGAYALRKALSVSSQPVELSAPSKVLAGSFDSYPLWFVVVADIASEGTQVAAVFERSTSTSPWLLTIAPRLAADTEISAVDTLDDGSTALLTGEAVGDLPASPDELVRRYADVLEDPSSRFASQFEVDAFITQMHDGVESQPREGVDFGQEWKAEPVMYAVRLADGGALVFGSLRRVDRYDVVGDKALQFADSEAGAILTEPVRRSATLTYFHDVLLYVPGNGRALAIGQYGGLVDATGR